MKLSLPVCLAIVYLFQVFGLPGVLSAREIRVSDRIFLVRGEPGTPTEFQMVVNAGSTDEVGGVSRGLAHYLEHLILNGRNSHNGNVAMRFFPDGRSNGRTNQLATVYTHSVPARAAGPNRELAKLFEFYAGQLTRADYRKQMAARERNVVLQEHDWRYGGKPKVAFYRKIDAILYRGHPYAHWTIGKRSAIAALTPADAVKFHNRWYHINNVWFVIKADIEPRQLKIIAEKFLKGLKPDRIPARAYAASPDTASAQTFITDTHKKIKQTTVYYRKLVRVPGLTRERGHALALVLRRILRTRLPGSLHHAISEQQQLTSQSPSLSLQLVTGNTYLLSLSARPAGQVDPRKLLDALELYVKGLKNPGFSDRTIKRIKARYATAFKRYFADRMSVYRGLVSWLASGRDYKDLQYVPTLIQEASRGDLEHLAAALAAPGRIVTGILAPAVVASGKSTPAGSSR